MITKNRTTPAKMRWNKPKHEDIIAPEKGVTRSETETFEGILNLTNTTSNLAPKNPKVYIKIPMLTEMQLIGEWQSLW